MVKKVIVEDCGYPTRERSKDLRGKLPHNYDGSKELPDPLQEEYIHRIIFNMGDRKKAYEEAFFPMIENPNYPAKAPYRYFERKGFVKRYNYLMTNALFSAGLDKKTLLLKTAALIERSVKSNKVRDFTSLVDTVLKLQVDENKYKVLAQPEQRKVSEDDLAPVKALMESLNG